MKKAANFIRPNYLVFTEPFGRTMQFKHEGPSHCDTNFQSRTPTGHTHTHITDRITAHRWHHTDTNRTHTPHVTDKITANRWHHTDTNRTHTPHVTDRITANRWHHTDTDRTHTHTTHHWQDYCGQVTSHTLHIVDRITANRWHHSSMRQHQERATHLDFLFHFFLTW